MAEKLDDKFTAGPWYRDTQSGYKCDVRAADGRKVALCYGLATPPKYKGETLPAYQARLARYRVRCDADARLIAQAPTLLEAARLILLADAMADDHPGFDSTMDTAVELLKKAVAKFERRADNKPST